MCSKQKVMGLRAAAAQSDDLCAGMIAYYSTELSRMAYTARKAAGFTSGRNVAVARVPGWNNPKAGDLVVGFSKGDGYHSEDHILDQLKDKNVKPSQIVELYSERRPCGACEPKLAEALVPGTPISWSVLEGPGSSDLLYSMIRALETPKFKRSAEEQKSLVWWTSAPGRPPHLGREERSMTEYGFARASDETIGIRNELARQVIQAIRDAGLPAFREGEVGSESQAGAVLHVDPDAETMSAAVSVTWRCDAGKLHSALEDLTSGCADTPATRYPGVIGAHMQMSLVKILLAAGIIATPTHDNMDPNHVLVFGRVTDLPPALRPTFVPPRN